MHKVVASGNLERVQWLVNYGADLNAKDNDGWTVLNSAVWSGNLEKVRVIIRGEKADLPVEIASGSVGFAEMIEKEGVGTISQRLSENKEGWYEIATG